MAAQKTTVKKSTKTTKEISFKKYGPFNKKQLLIFVAVFALIGGYALYKSYAASTNPYSCAAPKPALQVGSTSTNCVKYLQWVLHYKASQNLGSSGANRDGVDGQFGNLTKAGVVNVQNFFAVSPANGVVGSATWGVIDFLNGYTTAPPPPPPTGTGFGQKPPFSKKADGTTVLSYPELVYFGDEWTKWAGSSASPYSYGWCIINHESRTAGMYTAQNSSSTASGAFQFVDGTWGNFKGYSKARLAPPDVQWLKFFQVWSESAGAGHWNGTHCSPAS